MTNKLKPLSKIIGKIKGNVRIALPFFGIASLINGIIGTKNSKIDGKIPLALRVFGLVGGIIINIRMALPIIIEPNINVALPFLGILLLILEDIVDKEVGKEA